VAVNQVSLFLYPPRWTQRRTPDLTAMTDVGERVKIVGACSKCRRSTSRSDGREGVASRAGFQGG
jgi:hypothetical protein